MRLKSFRRNYGARQILVVFKAPDCFEPFENFYFVIANLILFSKQRFFLCIDCGSFLRVYFFQIDLLKKLDHIFYLSFWILAFVVIAYVCFDSFSYSCDLCLVLCKRHLTHLPAQSGGLSLSLWRIWRISFGNIWPLRATVLRFFYLFVLASLFLWLLCCSLLYHSKYPCSSD